MSTERLTTKEENERQYRIIDQMATMHSLLRDAYERLAFWLNTSLIGTSLFLCVFAFVGDDVFRSYQFEPSTARFVFGIIAVVVLILSITEFRVDWRAQAVKHAAAVRRLSLLKTKYRVNFAETNSDDLERNTELTAEYDRVTSELPAIPEHAFNKLKAEYQFKRILSQRISAYPKTPERFLRIQLRCEGISEAWRGRSKASAEKTKGGTDAS